MQTSFELFRLVTDFDLLFDVWFSPGTWCQETILKITLSRVKSHERNYLQEAPPSRFAIHQLPLKIPYFALEYKMRKESEEGKNDILD